MIQIRETKNLEEIKSILFHPDIFELARDGKPIEKEEFEPPLENVFYAGGYEDGKIFALSCFHKFRDGLKFHPNVLSDYRLKYGRQFVSYTATMLKYKIYIEIPEKRRDLFNLATKLGFDSLVNNKDSTNQRILMRLK